jgi:ATP-dependent exoDNAse (exonuclease V) alpha subunit
MMQPGQVLVFHRASRGIEKHEALTVTSASGDLITTRNERGDETQVSIGQARSFAVHERQSIEVAAGDKLLMLANRKDEGFRATNGELTTVRGVDRHGIHLDDGRNIPTNYREFTHGYAVTAHRSQGKTVDSVIISADVMKQELFYVSASRGREDIAILTSDVNRLGESLGVSMARPSAIELANEIAHSKEQSVDLTPKASIEVPPPQLEISLGHGFELSM